MLATSGDELIEPGCVKTFDAMQRAGEGRIKAVLALSRNELKVCVQAEGNT